MLHFKAFAFVAVFSVAEVLGFSYLDIYQRQFEELNREMIETLNASHARNSEIHRNFIEGTVLTYLGETTHMLQTARKDVLGQMDKLRNHSNVDHACMNTIEASLYMEIERSELWLQLCASNMYVFLKEDVEKRFHPVAQMVHRDAVEAVWIAMDVLADINAVKEPEEVEGRLDAELDYFHEVQYRAEQDLERELERHESLKDAVTGTFPYCVELLKSYFITTMYNLLGFAYDTCVTE